MKVLKHLLIFILIFSCTYQTNFAINNTSDGYQFSPGQSQNITIYDGSCKKVTNNQTNRFIPTRTATEWNTFVNAAPSMGVTLGSCVVNGGWSSWQYWYNDGNYACNSYNNTYYIRYCNNPAPANGGANCSGPNTTLWQQNYNGNCCASNMGYSCNKIGTWYDNSQYYWRNAWCTIPSGAWLVSYGCSVISPGTVNDQTWCGVTCGIWVTGTVQCNGTCQ